MKIWSGQFLNENDPLYNMILAYEINGEVDISRFKLAFQKLIDANDVFRLVIGINDGIPELIFHDSVKSSLEFIDFSNDNNAYQKYEDWIEINKKKIFRQGEYLYHAALFKISDDRFIFYLNQYHLITDGWSMKHVYDELNTYYKADLDTDSEDDTQPVSFESYARDNSFSYEEELTPYWKGKLANINTPTALYGVKPTNPSSKSTRVNVDLGEERTQKLKELAQDKDIRAWTPELALSNIFLTVISALVYKIGNQEEFSIGVPFHNRTSGKEKKIAGLFMELLPMEVEVNKDETLLDLFQKLKNESFEVIKNSVGAKPPVELLKTFNVLLNFIPVTLSDFSGMPMTCHWLFADHMDANHHIRLQIQDFNNTGNYKLQFDLNNDVFPPEEVNYVTDHFLQIVDAFIEDKNQKLNNLSLITDEEVKRINAWNATDVAYEENETILSQFVRQVKKTPHSVALIFNGEKLTYKELDEQSNQVAHFLMSKGIQKNDIVAISLERSFEMMIYIYGVIKAGAAYLPLDTEIPLQRLKFILEDTQSKILFFNHSNIAIDDLKNIDCFDTIDIAEQVSLQPVQPPEARINPDDLAYVIYTSGSTGEPKGVMCHHAGVCNRLNWMRQNYPITSEDTLIQKTPITFDVSVPELFFALQIGAKLVVEIPNGHKDSDGLIKTILDNNITVIHFVPSMLNVFVDTDGVEKCKNLKIIFCSGEALSVTTVENTYAKLDKVQIHNLYGPTEASVEVSSWYCERGELTNGIPIGHPVPNTQLYILDESLNLVPIGVSGELHIAGKQVANGYLNRETLNSKIFIKDIFSRDPDAKMYKTGDLARYRSDGAIEYLGRLDNQVKLRGLRIELGEIEKNIEKHPNISQAIVRVDKHANDEDYLVAYYTGDKVEDKEIKSLLCESLPSYMIPSFFVSIDKFELLTSGKVDRKKLKNINFQSEQIEKSYLEPDNEIEEIIVNVWKNVLKLEKIGVDESFIQIGGNSLNAIIVTSRLKTAFDLESLSITDVFRHPTVRRYGSYVESVIVALLEEEY